MGLTVGQKARRRQKAVDQLAEQVKAMGGALRQRRGMLDITGPLGGSLRMNQKAEWQVPDEPREQGTGIETMLWRLADLRPSLGPLPTTSNIDLTVFADASVCVVTGAAGWGAWWKSEAMPTGEARGGVLTAIGMDSDEAEAQALANALTVAAGRGHIRQGGVVMLQSDSMGALEAIRRRARAFDRPFPKGHDVRIRRRLLKKPALVAAVDAIRAIAERHNVVLIVRHVKGHSSGDGRNYVNRLCDKLAKEGMQARRAQITIAKPKEEDMARFYTRCPTCLLAHGLHRNNCPQDRAEGGGAHVDAGAQECCEGRGFREDARGSTEPCPCHHGHAAG